MAKDIGQPAHNKGLSRRKQMSVVNREIKKDELEKLIDGCEIKKGVVSYIDAIAILDAVGIERIIQLRGNGADISIILRRIKVDKGSFNSWLSSNSDARQKYLRSMDIDLLDDAQQSRQEMLKLKKGAKFNKVNAAKAKNTAAQKIIDGAKSDGKNQVSVSVPVNITLFPEGFKPVGPVVSEQ